MTEQRYQTRGMTHGDRVITRVARDGVYPVGTVTRVSIETPEVPRSRAVYVRWDTGHEEFMLTSELRRLK